MLTITYFLIYIEVRTEVVLLSKQKQKKKKKLYLQLVPETNDNKRFHNSFPVWKKKIILFSFSFL